MVITRSVIRFIEQYPVVAVVTRDLILIYALGKVNGPGPAWGSCSD
ncbi:MAG: hypothetical protein RXO23_01760 [Vulcanisaeta sp.]|nr:hypothetical protein [Vulcanisaeta sp.]